MLPLYPSAYYPCTPHPLAALLEPEQTRAARPLKEEELGSLLPRLKAAAQQERLPPPPTSGKPRLAIGGPDEDSGGAAGGAAGSKAGGSSLYASGLGGKVRPLASYELVTRGRQAADQLPSPNRSSGGQAAGGSQAHQQQQQQQQQQEEPLVEPMDVDASGVIEPEAALPLPRLGCACCGLSEHATEQCPLAMVGWWLGVHSARHAACAASVLCGAGRLSRHALNPPCPTASSSCRLSICPTTLPPAGVAPSRPATLPPHLSHLICPTASLLHS